MYFITENLLKHVTDLENMRIIYNIFIVLCPKRMWEIHQQLSTILDDVKALHFSNI